VFFRLSDVIVAGDSRTHAFPYIASLERWEAFKENRSIDLLLYLTIPPSLSPWHKDRTLLITGMDGSAMPPTLVE